MYRLKFSLLFLLFILGLSATDLKEPKNTRIIVHDSCSAKNGKCYAGSLMTTLSNCIDTCMAFREYGISCKCDVYDSNIYNRKKSK